MGEPGVLAIQDINHLTYVVFLFLEALQFAPSKLELVLSGDM
jgi:hypothetical protein